MPDLVNHPTWYNTGNIEVIHFIEDQQLNFHLGNAVKYICRAGKKHIDGKSVNQSKIIDLEKAVWYVQRYIQSLIDQQASDIIKGSSIGHKNVS